MLGFRSAIVTVLCCDGGQRYLGSLWSKAREDEPAAAAGFMERERERARRKRGAGGGGGRARSGV